MDPAKERQVRIGALRWPVAIARRDQTPNLAGAGVTDTLVVLHNVFADIQPVGAMTYYAGVQTDTPITHRVVIRHLDGLDTRHVITRELSRRDGTTRVETFRIRRMNWFNGDDRFLSLEVELEHEE